MDEEERNAEVERLLAHASNEPAQIVPEYACKSFCSHFTLPWELKCSKWKKCYLCRECKLIRGESLLEEVEVANASLGRSLLTFDAQEVSDSFFLAMPMPESDLSDLAASSMLAEIPVILDQNKDHVLAPKTSPSACSVLKKACGCKLKDVMTEEDCSCMADNDCVADPSTNTCTCSYEERKPQCSEWFYEADDYLIPIFDKDNCTGVALVAGCKCGSGECEFKMLSELPLLRLFEDDIAAITLND